MVYEISILKFEINMPIIVNDLKLYFPILIIKNDKLNIKLIAEYEPIISYKLCYLEINKYLTIYCVYLH